MKYDVFLISFFLLISIVHANLEYRLLLGTIIDGTATVFLQQPSIDRKAPLLSLDARPGSVNHFYLGVCLLAVGFGPTPELLSLTEGTLASPVGAGWDVTPFTGNVTTIGVSCVSLLTYRVDLSAGWSYTGPLRRFTEVGAEYPLSATLRDDSGTTTYDMTYIRAVFTSERFLRVPAPPPPPSALSSVSVSARALRAGVVPLGVVAIGDDYQGAIECNIEVYTTDGANVTLTSPLRVGYLPLQAEHSYAGLQTSVSRQLFRQGVQLHAAVRAPLLPGSYIVQVPVTPAWRRAAAGSLAEVEIVVTGDSYSKTSSWVVISGAVLALCAAAILIIGTYPWAHESGLNFDNIIENIR